MLSPVNRASLATAPLFLVFLSTLLALMPFSVDTYMPAIPAMADFFGVSISAVNLTMSAYLIGSALGQFIGGALSDHLGRRPVALTGLFLFTACSLLIIRADSIQQVQGLRFFQAFGGGFSSVICMAQLRDIFPAEEVARRYAGVMMVVLVAPLVAPMVGAVMMSLGWQSIFVLLTVYSAVCLLIFAIAIPETRLGPRTIPTPASLLKNYIEVIRHRVDGRMLALRYTVFGALSSALFMCYLTTAASIYMRHFQRDEYEFALMFGAGALSLMAGNRLVVRLMGRHTTRQILHYANLVQMLIAGLLVLIMLSGGETVWLVFALLLVQLAAGAAITPTVSGAFISFFDELSGSAASVNTTLIILVGASIGAIAAALSAHSITPIFGVMLSAAVAARVVLLTIR